ncbi:dinuclear metal center protein, YbgI/SA1388 family [Schinkia azotoformans MEV2011]|uniref:GTP cyclohydrolase 1 type 2 homolog n=1 Tax=Schinkia azotoformans MEV2011 TaxID=1348973 RepID=A0A072NRQ7_SCHAZ|nr:Nif3-like dinuclear metal center hexameric protein [Schinkia azotoformans]KEF35900.1 dinuclear metal center protein, YbgI/SA1388 family [Schinkia azotoformans MEV2011]MEC1696612.1 Nif3-like dinuclear metal center hexameric protein [Schinkia azotoformans]MEC1718555.1 Nif3-like dinuclear metal center hexameric protein [Schinkia azotoformans]MEC1727435.1 Nif3-like dinuclear metal center hexameric protein [Schinkia azotoformans]MEC1743453.1 Nif3-like dinuclear metal center hexameric protein [Sc
MRFPNGQEVIQVFEKLAPKSLAMDGDKIGLQIGTLQKPIKKIMITLDVLEDVVDEAIVKQVDLIIAHHPVIYNPLKTVITDNPSGRIVEKCLKNDITVYAAHTNLDVAIGGVNDLLTVALELEDTEVLVPTFEDSLKKLAVYVPEDHAEKMRNVLGSAGAGYIGNYSHCTFNSAGTGTFLPNDGANPFIGEQGKLEHVAEVKIETIFPGSIQNKVINAMLKAHPYEEPAYDIYPLENKGPTLGLGRIGVLKKEMTLKEFAEHVKSSLDVSGVRVVGDLGSIVRKVAVLGGDGGKFWPKAKFKGADVFVTGDLYYHVAHDAMMEGLNMVDPGHNVEKVMKQGVKKYLQSFITEKKYDTTVITSQVHTDPFQFM